MNDLHTLYTNGTDIFRIEKYVPPTDSIQGRFILYRNGKGCEVTLKDFLKDWKVFNSAAAFADYLLYTDQLLFEIKPAETGGITDIVGWIKVRCLEVGNTWATPVVYNDLAGYF